MTRIETNATMLLAVPTLLACVHAIAQESPALAPVVVTATRVEQSSFDLPASIDVVTSEQLRAGGLQINLSESLSRVPGMVVQNRQNYAQDLQISSRGFGARSTFGVRGLRLYADGIPATMPDGQGQVSHFSLSSADRVEVLRGPFSALYGNSSGGVIAAFTADGKPGLDIEPAFGVGSFGTRRVGTKLSGAEAPWNYLLDISRFRTDGYRDHSRALRDSGNAKLKYDLGQGSTLTITANYLDLPETQDPLGLTRAELQSNPRQASPVALTFDTRKSTSQMQGGFSWEHRLSSNDGIRFTAYTGQRAVQQFQAIPIGTQTPASSPGGVIDLSREYRGIDARWTHRAKLMGGPLTLTLGLNYDELDEARKGYQNFVGTTTGVLGALRRNEDNRVANFDQYVQAEWQPTTSWRLSAGIRHSRVGFTSQDKFIAPGNVDDSGAVSHRATTPVGGVVYSLTPATNLYATAGKSFETPTFNELAYRQSGSGLNFGLRPALGRNYEAGVKTLIGNQSQLNLALFRIRTSDEIVVLSNTGGRATFQNAGRTARDGAELAFESRLGLGFSLAAAFTYLRALYSDDFTTCVGTPCATTTVDAGKRIPGIARNVFYGEMAWRHASSGFSTALEIRAMDRIHVDDRNTDAAARYTIANWRGGFEQRLGRWTLREFIRLDNLFDRRIVGSVIVNEGNSRFFEPAPGRSYLAGISANYHFR